MDVNSAGFTSGLQTNGTLMAGPLVNGRITDTTSNVIYVISPNNFLMLNEALGNYFSVIQLFEQ